MDREDYEDNLYLSNQYGVHPGKHEKDWFSRGGMSMQACLLLDVEPYLFRDDVKHRCARSSTPGRQLLP